MATTTGSLSVSICRFALFLMLFQQATARAATQCSGDNLIETDHLVRDVKVDALFGRIPDELHRLLSKHRGELYRPFDISDETIAIGQDTAMSSLVFIREVREFLAKASLDSRFGMSRYDNISIKGYTACVTKVDPSECQAAFTNDPRSPVAKCVDVTVQVKAVHVNIGNLSSNLLSLARSNKLLFYSRLPGPLLAVNPTFWMDQDREYGTALVAGTRTNLFDLPAVIHGGISASQDTQLVLQMDGSKSIHNDLYSATTTLALLNAKRGRSVEVLALEGRFASNRQPHGEGVLLTNAGHLNGNVSIRGNGGPITKCSFGAGFRWANNRHIEGIGTVAERTLERAFESRMIADGHFSGGYMRGGVWFDYASPDNRPGSYRRLAAMFGLSREFSLPWNGCRLKDGRCSFAEKNAPAIGLEMIIGGGKAWGGVPEYARFYGGNSARSFLYDRHDSPKMTDLPDGPLIRSFGRNQAPGIYSTGGIAAVGGTAYWNFNVTVSLPIPAFSRPLIPPLSITGDKVPSCDQCKSLKDFVKNNVSEGKNLYIDSQAFRSLSRQLQADLALDPEDARTEEEKKEIEERLRKAEAAFVLAQDRFRPEADGIWREITPMVRYISDNANLYSVKPVVMFDVAHVLVPGATQQRPLFALGGGLQFTVVVAKFEAGYLRTLNRLPGDERGNFIVRMIFERLF